MNPRDDLRRGRISPRLTAALLLTGPDGGFQRVEDGRQTVVSKGKTHSSLVSVSPGRVGLLAAEQSLAIIRKLNAFADPTPGGKSRRRWSARLSFH
jgi:hypothetical protein